MAFKKISILILVSSPGRRRSNVSACACKQQTEHSPRSRVCGTDTLAHWAQPRRGPASRGRCVWLCRSPVRGRSNGCDCVNNPSAEHRSESWFQTSFAVHHRKESTERNSVATESRKVGCDYRRRRFHRRQCPARLTLSERSTRMRRKMCNGRIARSRERKRLIGAYQLTVKCVRLICES